MSSKLTCALRYVALLRLRLRLSSALHLHLCRLSRFRYYPPRAYSNMFVGGLSWDTTDEGLRNYFSEFGKVDACTIVRDADGKSRGFAFLTFEEPASVNAIDLKRAIPHEEHLRNTRYFVGGLAPHSTADSMRVFFSKYGKVVDATVMVDRETGRSKGFGFVTFEDNSNDQGNDAQLVGKLGLILDDKQIEVTTAQQRDQQRLRHAATTPTNNFNNGQVAAGNAAPMGSNMPFKSMNNPGAGDMSMMYQRMMSGMGNTPYGVRPAFRLSPKPSIFGLSIASATRPLSVFL
ncbi:hypothetical protein EDB92DRAFT_2118586 [Lactarius akahatsu]|uniref:RRM domain-containing protein n=1 Tax=Lactarius akahatsu TaxID=416441 RepID=A0AAD4L4T0_9AGAM|nr:hypothetical protein EDB92DRAFT_2118586 [Lactarius akahatsu]